MDRKPVGVVAFVGAVVLAACGKSAEAPAPTKCTADSDCAWSCESRGGCCPSPCGCTIPMHKADKKGAEDYNRSFCTPDKKAQCPTVGGCAPLDPKKPVAQLRCRAGACVSEMPEAGP